MKNTASSTDLNLNPNMNPINSNYSWIGVLEFLQEQYRSLNYKETEWLLEKQQMEVFINPFKRLKKIQAKIAKIEGELQAHESINKDLIKRIKMLEFSLRQERISSSKNPSATNQKDVVSQFFNEGTDFSLNNALANNENANTNIPHIDKVQISYYS